MPPRRTPGAGAIAGIRGNPGPRRAPDRRSLVAAAFVDDLAPHRAADVGRTATRRHEVAAHVMDALPEHDLDPVRSLAQYDDVEQVAAARDAHLDLFIVHATVRPVPGETPAPCVNARIDVARALNGTALHPGAPCRRTPRESAATWFALRRPGGGDCGPSSAAKRRRIAAAPSFRS